ncbi:d1d7700f-8d2b-4dc2-b355-046a6be7ff9e [Thermothielavioides terrestris]|uniref:D1d7700f-8d2b-4dc2-b355-046a6be7ff9e n=1 Tax=Thermothielavioides terrestris TaxID=2587410 RepID=A0A446B888_9PEZI|nr:d1d7700f-8d2b-4dc2-b355-046a6be7ff9e [Thermothielavioides terrestris]
MSRCLSTGSTASHASATTEASHFRESLGSDASNSSRHSSASYRYSDSAVGDRLRPRDSTGSVDPTIRRSSSRRRGYMRPQGTDFAASARARESVLSLGSIAHLQYYFARTGLLDGKGGRLARRRDKAHTLDLSALDPSLFLTPKAGSDHDSSYASMGSSPDLTTQTGFGSVTLEPGTMVESPVEEHPPEQQDEDYFSDEFDEEDPHMLPPTTSTYIHREKHIPKPPSMAELRADLTSSLDVAEQTLREAKSAKMPSGITVKIETVDGREEAGQPQPPDSRRPSVPSAGWYEIQGMNILDVMTLAIRAAKIYYTSHDRPDRLDAIKSEKQLRGELLSVMEILKRMATRGFAGGMRDDEFRTMDDWIAAVRAMLAAEDAMEAREAAERATWTWVHPEGWEGREFEREEAFMRAMLDGPDPIENMPVIPKWIPIDRTQPLDSQSLPTPFLAALSNGQRLVQLHNCAVRKSCRRFGAIPRFYADTQKPYRAADNLRYWLKAAELRWEVFLKADPLGLQYNTTPELWLEFEDAVLGWCRKVREEIAAELLQESQQPATPTSPTQPHPERSLAGAVSGAAEA